MSSPAAAALVVAGVAVASCGGTVVDRAASDRHADGGKSPPNGQADTGVLPAGDPNWTMLGYDLASTYWNRGETKISAKTAPQLELVWQYDAGSGANVTGTPVVADGKVYVVAQGVTALDLATGALIWQNASVSTFSSPALSDGVLYVHDGAAVVHAFRAADGTEIWQYQTTDLAGSVGLSSPVVTRDYVIVGGSTMEETAPPPGGPAFRGFVEAINKDGTLAWKKFTVADPGRGVSVWSTVSVDETLGVVYASTGNNHGPPATDTSDGFLAMPLAGGGDFRWTQQILSGDMWMVGVVGLDNDFGANPVVFDFQGKKLVAGGNKGGDFWVLDRESGAVVKKVNLGPGSAFKGGIFTAGAWDGLHLLTGCNGATSTEPGSEPADMASTGVLYALDPVTLDTVWARQIKGPVYGRISVAGGVGFFGKDATLQAFDTETGKVLKEYATDGSIATAPAVANGYVVFGSGVSYIQTTAGTKYYALKVP